MNCNELARQLGVHQCVLGYCGGDEVIPTERWLPLVGHIKDGKIDGTMFEGINILPSPVHVYYRNDLTHREGFDKCAKHVVINATNINEATRQVKEALNLPADYKTKLFFAVFNTHTPAAGSTSRFENWGELDGERMDPHNQDHCMRMMDYLIENQLKNLAEAKLEHVELLGFYMFDEGINLSKMDWYKQLNQRIHDKGYLSIIAPYFKSSGYNRCREAGFDLVSMQSNYFLRPLCFGNSGTPDRIDLNLERIKELGIGMVPECNGTTTDGVTAYKITLKKCLEHNQTDNYHMHYWQKNILDFYDSEEEYCHSAYDDLFKYIHGELKIDDIWMKELENPQGTIDRQAIACTVDGAAMTAEDWLPAVGYVKDGTITDAMYKMVVMQPDLNGVKDGKYNTKAAWDALVAQTFEKLDALDAAVEQVKQALNLENLGIGVVFGVINPTDYDNWGEIDGEAMNTGDPLHCRRMVKYQLDAYRNALSARGYKNVVFNGFRWMDDYIDESKLDWYVPTTDQIIDTRGFSMMVPAYKAPGHLKAYRAGFGMVPMYLNGKTEDELLECVKYNRDKDFGVVVELASLDKGDVDRFKWTLKSCITVGSEKGLHLYEFGNGPRTLCEAAHAADAYARSAYDELYAYLKHELAAEDMIIK